MILTEHVPLATLTTLKVGGVATLLAQVTSVEEVAEAVALARERRLPFYVLGEGSNVLPNDDGYDGVIIRVEIPGLSFTEEGSDTLLIAGAGVSWDAAVREAAARNLWGIENLAGIPGTMGAAPVQNIGAYGADLSQVLRSVDAYDAEKGEVVHIAAEDCALGYRDSRFKHEPNLIITSVTLALSATPAPRIEYGDLLAARERGDDLSTPAAIGDTVRAIRSKKFPDLNEFGTAGSFFKNPVLTPDAYAALSEQHGEVPRFPNPNGVKVPLAFILDKVLSLRGFTLGHASLFGAQPLVLVLEKGGKSVDIETLAQEVEKRVHEATGIKIEREVRTMPTK
ncbi:MAG TPA: UDP-N-acetylmuramate dehydrogenase [Candidatus Paceibacterota bacterium]|nr:UDP-N-acetylmuramate dehydrogenase [Candidatus Paceibacterota bacterium]